MNLITNIFKSSLGRKYIMAVTGFVMFGFVVGHLVGNLQIFLGQEAINRYGHFLQSNVELLWPVRIGLLLMLALHVWSAATLSRENKAARPVAYTEYRPIGSSYASRTMLMSGLIILAFIIYHLLHYTVQVKFVNMTGQDFTDKVFIDGKGRHDIYKMMLVGFGSYPVSLFYLVAIGLLCLHLSHGISSMFQSLGWKNAACGPILDRLARWIAVLIFLGYASIPIGILLGFVKEVLK
jgi:succinate dehydrogenase / fumarate reductase cytochrome b subunit